MDYNKDILLYQLVLFALVNLIYLYRNRKYALITFLFASLFFNKIALNFGDINLRLDQILCFLTIFVYLRSITWRFYTIETILIYIFCIVNIYVSLMYSDSPSFCLRKLSIIIIYIVAATMVIDMSYRNNKFESLFVRLMTIGNIVIFFSLFGMILFYVGFDLGFVRYTDNAWLEGPMINANIMGSTASLISVYNLHQILKQQSSNLKNYILFCASALAVLFSYTRSAWILFIFFSVMLVLLTTLRQVLHKGTIRRHFISFSIIFTLMIIAMVPLAYEMGYQDKIVDLTSFESGSGYGRVIINEIGITAWRNNPIWGTGWQNFEYLERADRDSSKIQQINMAVQILLYGGIISFVLFYGAMLIINSRMLLLKFHNFKSNDLDLASVLGLDLLLIAYIFTSGMMLGIFWFVLFFTIYLVDMKNNQRIKY